MGLWKLLKTPGKPSFPSVGFDEALGEAAQLGCSRVNAIGLDALAPCTFSLRDLKDVVVVLMSRRDAFFRTNKTISGVCGRSAVKYSQTCRGALIESSLCPCSPKDLDVAVLYCGSFPKGYHYLIEK